MVFRCLVIANYVIAYMVLANNLNIERRNNNTKPSVINSLNITQDDILIFKNVILNLLTELDSETKHEEKQNCGNQLLWPSGVFGKGSAILLQEDFGQPKIKDLLFESPGVWSACRRTCRVTRRRKCRLPMLCDVDVLIEEAPCYAPGTKCEKKLKHKFNSTLTKLLNESNNTLPPKIPNANQTINKNETLKNESKIQETEETENTYFIIENNLENNDKLYTDLWIIDYDDVDNNDIFNLIDTLSDPFLTEFIVDDGNQDYETEYYIPNNKDISEAVADNSTPKNERSPAETYNMSFSNAPNCGRSSIATPQHLFRVIGGRDAVRDAWPWQVAILDRSKEVFCGGTLLNGRWVLTAAHCIRRKMWVRVGEHDVAEYEPGEIEIKVKKTFAYPTYNKKTVDSDIALLLLPKDVAAMSSKTLTAACLPPLNEIPPKGQSCVVLGWGKTRESHIFGSDVLQFAKVPIVSSRKCQRSYPDLITNNMFCAGVLRGGIDACSGDSGGPLLCENPLKKNHWVLHGITSFGEGCGEKKRLGVYVKVSNYVGWIQHTISKIKF